MYLLHVPGDGGHGLQQPQLLVRHLPTRARILVLHFVSLIIPPNNNSSNN